MFEYILFLICSLGLVFVLARGGVIDIKTEYVPDNIVIGSYIFSIIYILISSILLKSTNVLLSGIFGFIVGFIIPTVVSNGIYYCRYFSLKRKFKKNNIELELEKEEEREKLNIEINKKYFFYSFCVIFTFICIISIASQKYIIIACSTIAIIIELVVNHCLKKFYVIKCDYTENKYIDDNEKSISDKIERDLEFGVGSGDILLFGAIGIMLSPLGFLIAFIYAAFAQLIIVIILSIIKKINPLGNYSFPFIPALSIGTLLYATGCDQYLINLMGIITNLFA